MFNNGNGKEAKIIKQLNELAALKYKLQLLEVEMERQINAMIPDEVLQQITDIKAELQPKIEAAQEKIENLEGEVKENAKEFGATVKGDELMVVYSAGRTSWDSKGLEGYAVGHKKLLKFKKVGNPSASLRAVPETKE